MVMVVGGDDYNCWLVVVRVIVVIEGIGGCG